MLEWLDGQNFWLEDAPKTFRVTEHPVGAEQVDHSRPVLIHKSDNKAGAGAQLLTTMETLGEHPLHEKGELMLELLEKQKEKMKGKAGGLFRPLGGDQDTFEAGAWVPRAWKKKGYAPEQMGGCSAPWLVVERETSWRADFYETPLPGLGQFWHQRAGSRLVVLWPVHAVTRLGV